MYYNVILVHMYKLCLLVLCNLKFIVKHSYLKALSHMGDLCNLVKVPHTAHRLVTGLLKLHMIRISI